MVERYPIDRSPGRLQWLNRLVNLFRVPTGDRFPDNPESPACETVITEDPLTGLFCTHTGLRRWLARLRPGASDHDSPVAAHAAACPICGLPRPETAEREAVLTVWFYDGTAYEYCFSSHDPDDCYRIVGRALHINLKESVLTYSLEVVSAVHFRKRHLPPVAPEVLEAQWIIAGRPGAD